MSTNGEFEGRVAIVTGASRGIGRGIALDLAVQGVKVALVARDETKLAEVAAAISEAGGEAATFACDITDGDAIENLVEAVAEKWEKIDILVNNAGVTKDGLMLRMGDDEWDTVINTNLRGAFLFTRSVGQRMMRARFGRIINIASVVGLMGNAGQANYAASKAGLIGLTKTVAKELASRGITANAVAPGFIDTDMTDVLPDKVKEGAKGVIPCKRFGKVEEIARAVRFLASPDCGYITGQVLPVDGGMTA